MRSTLIKIHKWIGLTFALLLIIQATSGVLMANKSWLQAYSGDFDSNAKRASLDLIIANIEQELPGHQIERIIHTHPDSALVARVFPADDTGFMAVYIDPLTAEVLSTRPFWQDPFQLAERIHVSLLAGDTGYWILLFEGLALITLTVLGIIIWWPRPGQWQRSFHINWNKGGIRRWRGMHTSPGAIASTFILMTALSGFLVLAEPFVKPIISLFVPVGPDLSYDFKPVNEPKPLVTWQQALDQINTAYPDNTLRQLRIIEGNRILGAILVATDATNPRAHHLLAIDRFTNELLVFQDANNLPSGDELINWFLPIHSGEIWGLFRMPLLTLIGLALMLIVVSGTMTWFLKRKRLNPS